MSFFQAFRNYLLVIGMIFVPSVALHASGQTIEFDIKQQPLTQALQEFAKQTKISLSLPVLSYKDGKNHPLKGSYTVKSALSVLLKGSGLSSQFVSPNAVLVRRVRLGVTRVVSNSFPEEKPINSEVSYIDEILISSTRRVADLAYLPYSASVVSLSDREQLGTLDTSDMAYRSANLHVTHQDRGRRKILIRGMSDGIFSGRVQSLVNTYLDNTRLTHSAADPGLSSLDVERIEILRGPQGTLYGSGSIGGLYRIVTNKPQLDKTELRLSSTLATTKGGGLSYNYATIINTPIIEDKVALRTAGLYKKNGGYIDDTRLRRKNINNSAEKSARLNLKIAPSEFWSVTFAGILQKFEAADTSYYNQSLGEFKRDNYLREPTTDKLDLYSVTLEANLGWAKITSSTTWLKRNLTTVLDATKIEEPAPDGSRSPSPFTTSQKIETISNETHLQSEDGNRLEWVAGSYWSERRENTVSRLTIPGTNRFTWNTITGNTVDYQATAPVYDDTRYLEDMQAKQKEFAVFGEATFHLTTKLSFTAGGRWFIHKNSADSWTYEDTTIGREFTSRTACIEQARKTGSCMEAYTHYFAGFSDNQTENNFIPKLLLSYSATENLLFYSQYSKGYRLGGINMAGPSLGLTSVGFDSRIATKTLLNFKSDSLSNYEVGIKYQSLDTSFKLNISAYLSKWRDIQSYQFAAGGTPRLENVGSARLWGVDLEALYKLGSAQTLRATVGWNNSQITNTESHFGALDDAPSFGAQLGESLPGAPQFTAGAFITHEFSVWDTIAALELSYNYVTDAKLIFNAENTPRASDYHLMHVRLNIDLEPIQLSLFLQNLLNSQTNVAPFNNPFNIERQRNEYSEISSISSHQVTPLRPRTIGLSLSWYY